jgi:hypothetical protein
MNFLWGDYTVFHDQSPALRRTEIQFLFPETQFMWNCSAVKSAFEGYHDLDFVFAVPAADGLVPLYETL